MRLQIFSDIHFDVMSGWEAELADDVDVVVVPGDICEGIERGLRWLRRQLGPDVPIVFVAGNHEFYNTIRPQERLHGNRIADQLGVTFLDDSEAVIGGVRFLGSTLWADFALFGKDKREAVMQRAERVMPDHRLIRESSDPRDILTPFAAAAQHARSRAWLDRALRRPFDGPTVVVTHHCPHALSVAEIYKDDLLTPAFASDLSAMIVKHQPALWLHGHTHTSFDYRVGVTRVVCNPHGYGYGVENPAFDSALVIEI
jgi:Calcineurin-like phosphoesterase